MEEELRMEINSKNRNPEVFQLVVKESHRSMDDDALLAGNNDEENDGDDEDAVDSKREEDQRVTGKIGTPIPGYIRRLRTPVCKQTSLPPSFTFRPPSNEDPLQRDNGSHLVPVDITISNYGSTMGVSMDLSGSSLEIPVTPSSCYTSDNSSYVETNIDDNVLCIPQMEETRRKSASPQQKQRLRDRRLVRQKSCEYESPPATDNPEHLLPPSMSNANKDKNNSVSMSQPSLNKNLYDGAEESKIDKSPHPIMKLKYLHRSQSSGAEKVKIRDKCFSGAKLTVPPPSRHMLSLSPHGRQIDTNSLVAPNILITQSTPIVARKQRGNEVSTTDSPHSQTTDSNVLQYSSCREKSPSRGNLSYTKRSSTCDSESCDFSGSDWAADEAACDEEVRMITGDGTDQEDTDNDMEESLLHSSLSLGMTNDDARKGTQETFKAMSTDTLINNDCGEILAPKLLYDNCQNCDSNHSYSDIGDMSEESVPLIADKSREKDSDNAICISGANSRENLVNIHDSSSSSSGTDNSDCLVVSVINVDNASQLRHRTHSSSKSGDQC